MLLQGFELLNLYIGNLAVIDGPDFGQKLLMDRTVLKWNILAVPFA